MFLIEAIGWAGTALVLYGYAYATKRKAQLTPKQNQRYQLVNALGAIALVANAGYHKAWPVVGLNIAWWCIASWGLMNA